MLLQVAHKASIEPMFRDILKIVRFNPNVPDEAAALLAGRAVVDNFCKRWAKETKFISYFQSQWLPKLGKIRLMPTCTSSDVSCGGDGLSNASCEGN